MSITKTFQSKTREVKAHLRDKANAAAAELKANTVDAFKDEVRKGVSNADRINHEIAVAAFLGEGAVPAKPTIPSAPKVVVEPVEEPVYTDYIKHYREIAPKSGWSPCSFREIKEGDWVRVSFTGRMEDARYGIVREFTDKNWWKSAEGHLIVGPQAIPSGQGQMVTGTMSFAKTMRLDRIPASPEMLAEIEAEREEAANKFRVTEDSLANKSLNKAKSLFAHVRAQVATKVSDIKSKSKIVTKW